MRARQVRLGNRLRRWLRLAPRVETPRPRKGRGPVDHVIILDGTLSTLRAGRETNAGLTYKLLAGQGGQSVRYEAGIQWPDWRHTGDVITGRGISRQIQRIYGYLASRYRPGDRIWLFGYSRGAYAARSLAGMIGQVGLLRADAATERNVLHVYRNYEMGRRSFAARVFSTKHCHEHVQIEMIGVWDTVKALGLRLPVLWRYSEPRHAYHDHALGPAVRRGYHALALDETRSAYAPVMWESRPEWEGAEMLQLWFRGSHADVGGQIGIFDAARPLSNIPLLWMLERAEAAGLALPEGWRGRFPCDPNVPVVGSFRGWGKAFLSRRGRVVGTDVSEFVHESVPARRRPKGVPVWPVVEVAGADVDQPR